MTPRHEQSVPNANANTRIPLPINAENNVTDYSSISERNSIYAWTVIWVSANAAVEL
jgi:hypothetical protein